MQRFYNASAAPQRRRSGVVAAFLGVVMRQLLPAVVALDQPLYAIAKKIQWQFPEEYGINKFVLMLGGLHTEMAFQSALGDWLDGSGWVQSLVQSSIASSGVAESFLRGNKVTKTSCACFTCYLCMHTYLFCSKSI